MDPIQTITKDINWARHHLIVMAVAIVFVLGSIYMIESVIAKHDAQVAAIYDARARQANGIAQAAINAANEQNALLQKEVDSLNQQMTARDGQLVLMQKQINNFNPQQLATEWMKFLNKGIAIAQPDGVKLDIPAAQDSLQQLESVPVLKQDKQALQDEVTKTQNEVTNAQSALMAEKTAHITDNQACEKDKEALKSDARKGKLKWAFIGAILSEVVRVVIKGSI